MNRQAVLHLGREATHKAVMLSLVGIDLIQRLLCKVVEHLHILHHRPASLLEVQKLPPFDLHNPLGNVIITEGLVELRRRHPVVGSMNGEVVCPPRSSNTLKLMGSEKSLSLS